MQRPDEPFEDRGVHPYGEGIDRYRSLEDLSDSEINYQEACHHFLNLLNPHFFGINGYIIRRTLVFDWFCASSFRYTIDGHFGWVNSGLHSLWLFRLHRSKWDILLGGIRLLIYQS